MSIWLRFLAAGNDTVAVSALTDFNVEDVTVHLDGIILLKHQYSEDPDKAKEVENISKYGNFIFVNAASAPYVDVFFDAQQG